MQICLLNRYNKLTICFFWLKNCFIYGIGWQYVNLFKQDSNHNSEEIEVLCKHWKSHSFQEFLNNI